MQNQNFAPILYEIKRPFTYLLHLKSVPWYEIIEKILVTPRLLPLLCYATECS